MWLVKGCTFIAVIVLCFVYYWDREFGVIAGYQA